MAFSGPSYFAGVGTAFVAVALGFAGGALVTTSAVQPPNRLERVTSHAPAPPPPATPPSNSSAEQPNVTTAQPSPPPDAPTATPSQKADSQPVRQLPASAEAGSSKGATTMVGESNKAGANALSSKSDDTAQVRNDRANARSADTRKEGYRKRSEERKFSERKRRHDLDEAANTARQARGDEVVEQVVVERDAPPRLVERAAPRPGFFGIDEGPPRARREAPSPFGFFGNE